jgi:hypothetical protein
MTQEGEAELSVVADAFESVVGEVGDLIDCDGAPVGKLFDLRLPHTCSMGLTSGA